jgi:hypothetical protein
MVKRVRKRSSGPLILWVSVGVVVALVATFVLVKELNGTKKDSNTRPPTSATVFDQVTKVPASVFDAVGVNSPLIPVTAPTVYKDQPSYKVDGMPGTFYYGAEYCPYCAATRWGVIVALSRFGTFDKLYNMWSSSTDPAGPDTPTFTFYGTNYTSKYFKFTGYEVEDRNGNPLMSLPSSVNTLVKHYNPGLDFPYMNMGNKVMILQTAFDPLALQGYKTQSQISSHLNEPSNAVTQAIITTANYVSAGLCSVAKDPPASVCHSSGVEAAAAAMNLTLP